ncbi:MAG: vitamin K epoxide reductase family protein [Rhodoluna sp.]|nr:vitamin K epoxide reductase family protein [Rhodoluna sp.]
MSDQKTTENTGISAPRSLAIVLIIFGIIGWIGAFSLTLERIHVATDPGATLGCDLNIFISCKTVMLTWQAKLFGFPNSLIGIAAFMAPIIVGFAILAKAQFAKWFWRLFLVGNFFGFLFVLWLFSQSLLVINVLCPYCMVAWTGMIPIFVTLFLFSAREDIIPMPIRTTAFWDGAFAKAWLWTIAVFLIIILAITFRFWTRWIPMFSQLGWI